MFGFFFNTDPHQLVGCLGYRKNTYLDLPFWGAKRMVPLQGVNSPIPLGFNWYPDWKVLVYCIYYVRLFWGCVFPYISRFHTADIGEYLHFRYLIFLVIAWIVGRLLSFWEGKFSGAMVNFLSVSLGDPPKIVNNQLASNDVTFG